MKKIYNAPEASLLCFRPMETLANDFIDFGELVDLSNSENKSKAGTATEISTNDILITF